MAKSRRDIDNTRKLIKKLKNIQKTMFLVGERYKIESFNQWTKGNNVGGEPLDPLSPAYKKFKTGKGRSGLPDLEFSSTLRKSLRTKLTSKGVSISINVLYGQFVADRNDDKGLWGMTDRFRKDTLSFMKKRLSPA